MAHCSYQPTLADSKRPGKMRRFQGRSMTEEEWLTTSDPSTLLMHVYPIWDNDPRMRKVLLFTAA
jgi:hypothetical protein